MNSIFETPVYPIPPFFSAAGYLDNAKIQNYVAYLVQGGAKAFMTTVGTSGYNLLELGEIQAFNYQVHATLGNEYPLIVGLPIGSVTLIEKFLDNLKLTNINNRYFMAVYPDRYYDDDGITAYFQELSKVCSPLFIHGLHIRKGVGGGYHDYNGSLMKNILDNCPKVIGMKEECSGLEKVVDLFSGINSSRSDFESILAGGSQRRFLFGKAFGATNFLAGLGSFKPYLDNSFFDNIHETGDNRYDSLTEFIEKEDTLFQFTSKHGWHPCMREGICSLLNTEYYPRSPFPALDSKTALELYNLVSDI